LRAVWAHWLQGAPLLVVERAPVEWVGASCPELLEG